MFKRSSRSRVASSLPDLVLFFCVTCFVLCLAPFARAGDSPMTLSLSAERLAGVAITQASPTSAGASVGLTTYGVGGVALSPLAVPRIGADVVLPNGLTLGAAVGFGGLSLSASPSGGGASSSVSGNAWLLTPRVGYMFRLSPLFDLTPRVGVTFSGASLDEPGSSCNSVQTATGTAIATSCNTADSSASIFFVTASVEVAAALRLTRSFNLLAGLGYDHVLSVSASTTSTQNSTSSTSNADASGNYDAFQAWLGLGGYIF